jgi:putative membrane protein
MTRHRFNNLTLTVLCIGALGACSKGDGNADTLSARTDTGMGRMDSTANMNANATNASWSNDRVFGFSHGVDSSEIAIGNLAATKGTHAQVKAFGRQMVTDHKAMMGTHRALMTKLNAKMDTTGGDARDMMDKGRDQMKDLTEKAKGAEWDREFIDGQIATHERVLERLQDAAKNSTDTELKAALPKAAAKVQEHLTKAQALKATLDASK